MKNSRTDHYFIYCKDNKNRYTGTTICVLLRNGMMYHGESFCSEQDQFSKKVGRAIAFARAEQAFEKYTEKCEAKV